MALSLEDLWTKAAVEHRLLTITYKNPETSLVYTKREVRPDWIGPDSKGNLALWGVLDHNPYVGMRAFLPRNFQEVRPTNRTFSPPPNGRWKELVSLYQEKGLDKISF